MSAHAATMRDAVEVCENNGSNRPYCPPKLHGRAFYESIGSPKLILAPMVDQSEFAWRMLTRSFMSAEENKRHLAYTPMFHSKLFADGAKYRKAHFEATAAPDPTGPREGDDAKPYLDGNPTIDRPLFVQFCSHNPDDFVAAAHEVAPYCDAVDLNLGCPQGIAKRGHYGAFLQEDWDLIYRLINRLHNELSVPVTAKMRILDTKEKTLDYAKMILSAGASIITVHGRQRDQKGHNTGVADWSVIRYLRDNLPSDTVMFANGNILLHEDIAACLEATGVDGVMSAEGNLHDPSIFATPPPFGQEGREYWRGRDGKGGYRIDAVLRRYLDILYEHVLGTSPPQRPPLFVVADLVDGASPRPKASLEPPARQQNESKRRKEQFVSSPNLSAMQPHLFQLMRPLLTKHTDIRTALAQCKHGNMDYFEWILRRVEDVTAEGLVEREADPAAYATSSYRDATAARPSNDDTSDETVERCRRPWWVCQPYVRPLPAEAVKKGSMMLSKKEKARLAKADAEVKEAGLHPGGTIDVERSVGQDSQIEVPKEGMVCG